MAATANGSLLPGPSCQKPEPKKSKQPGQTPQAKPRRGEVRQWIEHPEPHHLKPENDGDQPEHDGLGTTPSGITAPWRKIRH